ncbi:hypothetical protein ABKN59_004812 [Abortiporus biennis]
MIVTTTHHSTAILRSFSAHMIYHPLPPTCSGILQPHISAYSTSSILVGPVCLFDFHTSTPASLGSLDRVRNSGDDQSAMPGASTFVEVL